MNVTISIRTNQVLERFPAVFQHGLGAYNNKPIQFVKAAKFFTIGAYQFPKSWKRYNKNKNLMIHKIGLFKCYCDDE